MNEYEAYEQAYRNGYARGLKDRGEKTADEMFRELGYVKTLKTTDREIVYYDPENENAIKLKAGMVAFAYWKVGDMWKQTGFNPGEIRAVCKRLDEMGVE